MKRIIMKAEEFVNALMQYYDICSCCSECMKISIPVASIEIEGFDVEIGKDLILTNCEFAFSAETTENGMHIYFIRRGNLIYDGRPIKEKVDIFAEMECDKKTMEHTYHGYYLVPDKKKATPILLGKPDEQLDFRLFCLIQNASKNNSKKIILNKVYQKRELKMELSDTTNKSQLRNNYEYYQLNVEPTRDYVRHTESWEVRGHYRKYKNGKVVYVNPYKKGNGILSNQDIKF